MESIVDLFESKKDIYRSIEKVITYDAAQENRLKSEISEYVVTERIEAEFERLLSKMQGAMENADANEIGVWVSGFYGSGKSSFTKYFGLALDENVMIEGTPFLQHFQNRFHKPQTKAQLSTIAKRYSPAVVMLDLASEMLTGATMEEVSTVLYYKVLQWAGYSRNLKIAALERKLKKDGRYDEFEHRFRDAINQEWSEYQNDELVIDDVIPQIAHQMYPELFKTPQSFSTETKDFIKFENERVEEMLNVIREKSGKEYIIFIIDEVGQYVGARQNLILNLDGLAKNLKNIGKGKVWIFGTAQQTLTDDDQRVAINSSELFKLKDRFPIQIDLPSNDIREICYKRLLEKSPTGSATLESLFDQHGQKLRYNTKLEGAKFYDSDFNKEAFVRLYPFLPAHFDILLHLLGRLAKSTGGIGLRSAIKVIQDVLIEETEGRLPVAKQPVGWLPTMVTLYDSLENDIQRAFPSIRNAAEKAIIRSVEYDNPEIIKGVVKAVALLQILENIPVTVSNVASLMHSGIEAESLHDSVDAAVNILIADKQVPFGEQDGNLCFFSEKLNDIEQERSQIPLRSIETRRIFNEAIKETFDPLPSTRFHNTVTITSGLKVMNRSSTPASIAGDRETIQTLIEFVDPTEYEDARIHLVEDSRTQNAQNFIYIIARRSPEIDEYVGEIYRSQEICVRHKNEPDAEVRRYCDSQKDRSTRDNGNLQTCLLKSIAKGSFVFRGQVTAIESLDKNPIEASKKILAGVAAEVFNRYGEAPIRADTALAEKFLRVNNLAGVSSDIDPMGLVQIRSGTPSIQTDHTALISIRDFIERKGSLDGRSLGNHFSNAPFGWSKDTLRYLVAALFYAGELKLTVSGHDITANGQRAIDALKTNNSFNSVGVSLREGGPSNEELARAAERLTELIGDQVIPLEQAISSAATKHFPLFQSRFGPLGEKLKSLEIPGAQNIESLNEEISDILVTDASDISRRLGSEESVLYERLKWALEVEIAFKQGLENLIKNIQRYRDGIKSLPQSGTPGQLVVESADDLERVDEILSRSDFYKQSANLNTLLTSLRARTTNAAIEMADSQKQTKIDAEIELSRIPGWRDLTNEEQISVKGQLEDCFIETTQDLQGLKQLLNQEYVISSTLATLKRSIEIKGRERQRQRIAEAQAKATQEGIIKFTRTVRVPATFNTLSQIEDLIRQLQELKEELIPYREVEVTINLED